ncbi:Enhancer of polycomb-like protein 1, partial [Rhizopus azygosporus]
VPQIETGVEKEEEEEHDLQAAISAAQAAVTTGVTIEKYIPTPDASRLISDNEYNALYKKKYKESTTLIKFSSTVEDCIGCPYVMDEEDDAFLQSYNKQYPGEPLSEDTFESIMNECESITNQNWPHLYLDPEQTPDFKTFKEHVPDYSKLNSCPSLPVVFEHWRKRRLERRGKSIVPQLKLEETVKNELDPYICFRRRETKPVRKTRRTDQQSLERLRKLRSEMEMARNLLEMVLRREKIRKESLVLEHAVFDKKILLQDYQRKLGIKEDEDLIHLSSKKKRKVSIGGSSGATIKIPLHKLRRDIRIEKSPAQLAIEAELARRKEADFPYEDVTEDPYQPFPLSTPHHFFQSLSNKPSRTRYRKRMGRGGRIFIDRCGYSARYRPTGGKTRPGELQETTYDRFRFDSDNSDTDDEDGNELVVDEMSSLYLKHR